MAAAMAWCALVAGLLGLGALALERALGSLGRPARWVWLGSLLLSLAAPALLWLAPGPPSAPPAASALAAGEAGARVERLLTLPDGLVRQAGPSLPSLDGPLRMAWGAASGLIVVALGGMSLLLRRRRKEWASVTVDGRAVLVSPHTGPAVVGLLRSEIVLPRWALAAPAGVREMMLAHEEEHLRAGDPRLLLVGLAVLVAMPWSPALWWQLRRLRLAVEMDCDRRVLRRRTDVKSYGTLLLEIGRRSSAGMLAVAAFAEPASFLERRIRAMTAPRARTPLLRAAGFGVLAAAALVAACESPRPGRVNPVASEQVYADDEAAATSRVRLGRETLREQVAAHFPAVLERGMEGHEALVFVADAQGNVLRTVAAMATEQTAPSQTGESRIRVRGPMPGMDGIEPGTIASVNVSRHPAGRMGPDAVQVIWVTLKGGGEQSAAAPLAQPAERVSVRIAAPEGDGTSAAAIRAALSRHYPGIGAGDAEGEPVTFVVDARGEVVQHYRGTAQEAANRLDPASIQRVEVIKGAAAGNGPGVVWITLKDGATPAQ